MKKYKTLLVMIEGGGNVAPMFGLAKKLIRAGHEINILTEPCLKKAVESIGATFIPFKEYFTREDRNEDIFNDWDASKFNSPVLKQVIFGPAGSIVNRTRSILQSENIDLLVVDMLLMPALMAGESAKVPSVLVFHMPEILPGSNRPPGNMGIKPGKGLVVKWRDRLLGNLMHLKFNEFKPSLNSIREQLLLKPLENTLDLIHKADLRLMQTLKSFDVPVEPFPENIRYVGPDLENPDWVSTESDKLSKTKSDKPLVVVSFSSTFQNQSTVLQRCIDAMRTLPVYVCVTLGPAVNMEEIKVASNVTVLQSANHSELFKQANLVICHGGHGTIMRALSHGVPLICMPMGRDQFDNAIKVAMHGCGINLSAKVNSNTIEKAVNKVLKNENYQLSAMQFKREIEVSENMEEVLEEIGFLIEKSQSHFTTQTTN